MPELPEVETTKNDLATKITGSDILSVEPLWGGIVKEIPFDIFAKAVTGAKIVSVSRRAKNLIITLSQGLSLLIHLKMTGHLIVTEEDSKVDSTGCWRSSKNERLVQDSQNQFIRIIFHLSGGKFLAMSDLRKFAYIKLVDQKELTRFLSEYGPEPFSTDFNQDYLKTIFAGKGIPIKKMLMDQKKIAGIGNIYADEILWQSHIHPLRPASSLSDEEITAIYKNTKTVLAAAIKNRGTSTSDFRDTEGKRGSYGDSLAVYRRTGLPCPVCGGPVRRISLGGRGTHFCPVCQKEAK